MTETQPNAPNPDLSAPTTPFNLIFLLTRLVVFKITEYGDTIVHIISRDQADEPRMTRGRARGQDRGFARGLVEVMY